MAIGDAVSTYMGTAETDYQPSSGVEVQITGIVSNGTTDSFQLYDGTNTLALYDSAVATQRPAGHAGAMIGGGYNLAIMITNGMYLRKAGTTDRDAVFGVQTNA